MLTTLAMQVLAPMVAAGPLIQTGAGPRGLSVETSRLSPVLGVLIRGIIVYRVPFWGPPCMEPPIWATVTMQDGSAISRMDVDVPLR